MEALFLGKFKSRQSTFYRISGEMRQLNIGLYHLQLNFFFSSFSVMQLILTVQQFVHSYYESKSFGSEIKISTIELQI